MKDSDDNVHIIVMKRMSVYVPVARRKEEKKMREKSAVGTFESAYTSKNPRQYFFLSLSILTYFFNKQKHGDIIFFYFIFLFIEINLKNTLKKLQKKRPIFVFIAAAIVRRSLS